MENSYRFFENRDCRFYPCHKDMKEINCLFCYCPLYAMEYCPGSAEYKCRDGRAFKVCTDCRYPHEPENYDDMMRILREQINGQ